MYSYPKGSQIHFNTQVNLYKIHEIRVDVDVEYKTPNPKSNYSPKWQLY